MTFFKTSKAAFVVAALMATGTFAGTSLMLAEPAAAQAAAGGGRGGGGGGGGGGAGPGGAPSGSDGGSSELYAIMVPPGAAKPNCITANCRRPAPVRIVARPPLPNCDGGILRNARSQAEWHALRECNRRPF
ncbi:MAG: hypothetical protein MUC44_15475 [Beijerinckiaceae bacterium]|nr:hypothetical protein [Beijerinckiaceae bacterium]